MGLEHFISEERIGDLELFNLEISEGCVCVCVCNLINMFKYLKEGAKKMEPDSSVVLSDRFRGNGH